MSQMGTMCTLLLSVIEAQVHIHLDEQSLTVKLGQTYSLGNLDYVNVL